MNAVTTTLGMPSQIRVFDSLSYLRITASASISSSTSTRAITPSPGSASLSFFRLKNAMRTLLSFLLFPFCFRPHRKPTGEVLPRCAPGHGSSLVRHGAFTPAPRTLFCHVAHFRCPRRRILPSANAQDVRSLKSAPMEPNEELRRTFRRSSSDLTSRPGVCAPGRDDESC